MMKTVFLKSDDFEWDDFGNDLYNIPETLPLQSTISIPVQGDLTLTKEEEESRIKALINTPSLDWQCFGPGRGFGRGMMGARGRCGFYKKTPPQAYICHRCKMPGHFIQHCPTNGDPNFDVRRVRPPTGIPKSMLMANPDGLYALPSGATAVLTPNEAAFEKAIEGMPSTRSVGDLPPELHCPLCKQVMKDAVLTSKCCFSSFCDRCIRDHIISKSMCTCGAKNILADDLLLNKTLRDTITRFLESNNDSAENGGSAFRAPSNRFSYNDHSLSKYCGSDMESRNPQGRVPSTTQSAASKSQQEPAPPTQKDDSAKIAGEDKSSDFPLIQDKGRSVETPDVSEATHESRAVKEAASQGSAPLADGELQHKPISGEAAGAAEMEWITSQDFVAPENYMMQLGSSAFNPYWNGFMTPPYGGGLMPYMGGYGFNPMGYMMPYGPPQPQRELAELAKGLNAKPPIMSISESEAHRADLKRMREMEKCDERQSSKDGEYGREGSTKSHVCSRSMKKSDHKHRDHHHRGRSISPSEPQPASYMKPKTSVFSCISFSENDSKKRKPSSEVPTGTGGSSSRAKAVSNGSRREDCDKVTRKSGALISVDYDDNERHFKRRLSRYGSTPSPVAAERERRRYSSNRR